MAHFAKLDENNVVIDVVVVNNETLNNTEFPESEAIGVTFLTEWSGGYTKWKQTSYNASFRKKYAFIGGTYDEQLDKFIPPKPLLSWVLNENDEWQPPIPKPNDGENYTWDEENINWKKQT